VFTTFIVIDTYILPDEFGFECEDLGELQKIVIGHDNSGFGGAWFLDKVVVTSHLPETTTSTSSSSGDNNSNTKQYFFLCGRWLAKNEDDGKIEREIPASNKDGQTYAPMVSYRVTTITGDRRGAGTDANVFIQVFGDKGNTSEIKLSNAKNNFERGTTIVRKSFVIDHHLLLQDNETSSDLRLWTWAN
jgi:hypothetical protein